MQIVKSIKCNFKILHDFNIFLIVPTELFAIS